VVQTHRLVVQNHRLVLQVAKAARLGVRTHTGVCRLRRDLERRVADSQAFLRANPGGIPGIPAKTIEASITNERSTIRSLHVLSPCPS
jgi:hypothetical protein